MGAAVGDARGWLYPMLFARLSRRDFSTLLGGLAASWPLAARAQQRPLIGFLAGGSKTAGARYYSAVGQGLQALGYLEGRDFAFEERYADGDSTRLPRLAEELVRLRPRVLIAAPMPAIMAAKRATNDIPIVGINMYDPVGLGLIASEARPASNVTGVLVRVQGQAAKQLEIALDAVAGEKRIGVLINANSASNMI